MDSTTTCHTLRVDILLIPLNDCKRIVYISFIMDAQQDKICCIHVSYAPIVFAYPSKSNQSSRCEPGNCFHRFPISTPCPRYPIEHSWQPLIIYFGKYIRLNTDKSRLRVAPPPLRLLARGCQFPKEG